MAKKVTKKKTVKKKMGRPTKFTEEKIRQLIALMRVKPSLIDTQELLGIDSRTIERFIKKEYGMTFTEFREQKMAWSRHMIIREILEQCKKGHMTALIYASKNLCGWKDKHEHEIEAGKISINIDKSDSEL